MLMTHYHFFSIIEYDIINGTISENMSFMYNLFLKRWNFILNPKLKCFTLYLYEKFNQSRN